MVLATAKIEDFETFWSVFSTKGAEKRGQYGSKGARVHRDPNDADRIWVTVHVSDDEAEEIWADDVGFPRSRIQRLDKDNFWEMGDTGPCGPSSEIFWDNGPEHGPEGGPANPEAANRYVEIWNLVFPQYLRVAGGKLEDLPSKNIDTGAGLERIMAVLNGSHSLYDSDILTALVEEAQSVTGHRLGESELGDIALRLMADHARTMTFLVADGVIPSNEDRGYVLRRIIRRAVRYAYRLGAQDVVTGTLVDATVEVMGAAYPDLVVHRDVIVNVITREEERFRQTLERHTRQEQSFDSLPCQRGPQALDIAPDLLADQNQRSSRAPRRKAFLKRNVKAQGCELQRAGSWSARARYLPRDQVN